MGNKKNTIKEFISFNIIGIINTAITFGIYSLLIFYGFNYKLALAVDYSFGIIFSFIFNKIFTFKNKERINIKMILSMITSYIFIFFINLLFLIFFIQKLLLNEYLAQFFALSISILISFCAQKFIVFKKSKIKENY